MTPLILLEIKAWGDEYLKSWKRNAVGDLCGDDSEFTSKVCLTVLIFNLLSCSLQMDLFDFQLHCSDSSSTARFCAFENVLFDFSKMSRVKRPGRSDSRKWEKGFLASHCRADKSDINFYQVLQYLKHAFVPYLSQWLLMITLCTDLCNEVLRSHGRPRDNEMRLCVQWNGSRIQPRWYQ